MTIYGLVLAVIGLAGLFFSFGPASFGDQLSGRVDVVGTVQWGLSRDAISADDSIADDEYGLWKVDYEIDGSAHTGMIIGSYHSGQQISVSAPGDGSIYGLLRESVPTSVKVLSWFLVPLSIATLVAGLWFGGKGIRRGDAEARAEALESLSRRHPNLFPPPQAFAPPQAQLAPPPPPQVTADTLPPVGRQPQQQSGKPNFYAPYDI